MSFSFAAPAPRRRPSLTPMIDVVFLLLIFFMLAARFGQDAEIALTSASGGSSAPWEGPPRLVDIAPDTLRLNGRPVDLEGLLQILSRLTETLEDPVILRPIDRADTQRLIDIMAALQDAGFTTMRLAAP